MKNITHEREQYRSRLEAFLAALNEEKKYFNLNLQRVLGWETILIEDRDGEVVAVAGVEKKLGIARNCLVIKSDCQGRGLGKSMTRELIKEAGPKHALMMAVISKDNAASIKMHAALGYRMIGRRGELDYYMLPMGIKGSLLHLLMKILFPVMKAVDLVRR